MKKVIIYTLSTCPWCRKTEKFFTENHIPFEHVDYDLAGEEEQEKIMEEMKRTGGTGAFPYVRINGEVIVGYNPKKYAALMGVGRTNER